MEDFNLEEEEPIEEDSHLNRAPLIVALLAAIGGLILLSVFAYLLLRSPSGDAPVVVDDSVDTPSSVVPADNGEDALISVQVGESPALSLTVKAPNSLIVGDRQFAVQKTAIGEDGIWAPTIQDENTVVWVRGTIVNYVVAMLDTQANRDLMMGLDPNSAMQLVTKNEGIVPFTFSERLVAKISNQDIFAQTAPGVTVVMIGQNPEDDRLVIRGRYEFDQSAEISQEVQQPAGPVKVKYGEWAQLGDAKIVVARITPLTQDNSPFISYLVDYQVDNASSVPLDTTQLQFVLADDAGNQYQLNTIATQSSELPPLAALLEPGGFAQSTAGYQIPAGLDSGALRWLVRRLDTGDVVEVQLGDDAADVASVALTTVISLSSGDVSEDGGSMILQGQIINLAEKSLVVEQTDVSMRSSDGATLFVASTNPGFPWIVNAGATLPFSVVVPRPQSADMAVFTVMHQSFELKQNRQEFKTQCIYEQSLTNL